MKHSSPKHRQKLLRLLPHHLFSDTAILEAFKECPAQSFRFYLAWLICSFQWIRLWFAQWTILSTRILLVASIMLTLILLSIQLMSLLNRKIKSM